MRGMDTIYHLALARDWEEAEEEYAFSTVGVRLEDAGFMHCSFGHQVRDVAQRYYAGRDDVLVLAIDPARVDAEVRVEALGTAEAFPHIYGPLPRAAVISVTPWGEDWRPLH